MYSTFCLYRDNDLSVSFQLQYNTETCGCPNTLTLLGGLFAFMHPCSNKNCMLIPDVRLQWRWQIFHVVTPHANPPLGLCNAVLTMTLQNKILSSSLEPLLNKPVQSSTIHHNSLQWASLCLQGFVCCNRLHRLCWVMFNIDNRKRHFHLHFWHSRVQKRLTALCKQVSSCLNTLNCFMFCHFEYLY